MSFKNIHNHIKIREEDVQSLFNSIKLELEKLSTKSSLDNKLVIAVFRSKAKDMNIIIKQQAAYEILSQLLGIKNYNIAISKNVDFSSLFFNKNKDFGFHVESFVGGSGKSTLEDAANTMRLTPHPDESKIPTGVVSLDEDLSGGLHRGQLTTVLGGVNIGKSMMLISMASSAIRAGYKVLHINLEGTRDECLIRYTSNLSNNKYSDMLSNKISPEVSRGVSLMKSKFSKKLKIRNMLGFGVMIEDVFDLCKETYEEFPFDMVVVDYGQLLEAKGTIHNDRRKIMAKVYRGLDMISKVFNCAVLTAATVTRSSNNAPILRSEHVEEAMEIARVSSIILSMNSTDDERDNGNIRLFLEKQRNGVKNKVYGLRADFPRCNLVAGNYDPYKE